MLDVFYTFAVIRLHFPHPLIQATIESMRPQLWENYREIVKRYQEEGWGIYDDSADMDRAVVISDAYYGDGSSSMVQLYKKTGKMMAADGCAQSHVSLR